MRDLVRGSFISRLAFLLCLCMVGSLLAELPPDLPGEEISDQFLRSAIPADTTKPAVAPKKTDVQWYDKVAKTWEAPQISEQMSKDRTIVPMGKGGIFVPRLTELHKEPDIEIVDSVGRTRASGEPGITYSLEPGKYSVIIGSGNHRQRIVRHVEVQEFKTTLVLPDWSGLIIETIDTNTTTFKGEYEVVRIDEFEPMGRGYGAEVALGEAVKAWILKPGIYKILGRGESYNTLKNFVTVRLLPGELSRLVLIERPEDLAIMGGGTIDVNAGKKIASNWKYGGNFGGNVQFVNNVNKKENQKDDFSSMMSLNSTLWLRYLNNPFEWETSIGLMEGFNLRRQLQTYSMQGAADDFKISSLFIWRFYKWLGPYGSSELTTTLLPKTMSRDEKEYFLFLNENDSIVINARTSTASSFKLNPSFCPLTVDIGGGVNIDALNLNYLDITVRLGAGSSYSSFPDKYVVVPNSKKPYDSSMASVVDKSTLLRFEKRTDVFGFGPVGVVNGSVRIGRFGSAGAELKVFASLYPENRFVNPDFDLKTIVSWRIMRAVTLDYIFNYQLKQPVNKDAKVDLATNTVLLRFSYASR